MGPTRKLLEALGNPECHFSSIHVGGTNGKGSVATMAYSALRHAGVKAALYTSPHLVDLRERMLVDDHPIPRGALRYWTDVLHDAILAYDASFFEATTAIAFADFAARGADVAVVEVGLGGRLDATNVLNPMVSAVTGISLEHTEYLGPSFDHIAFEKAGIAKPGRPFLIGEQNSRLSELLARYAEEHGALVNALPEHLLYEGPMTMDGLHQRRNAAVAEAILQSIPATLRPDAHDIERGIGSAYLPGRFDRRGKWLFDVAHNPSSVEALVTLMREARLPRPVHAIFSMVREKNWKAILPVIRSEVDEAWLTLAPSIPENRRPDIERMLRETGADYVREPDFDSALANARAGAGTVLVTGSFYTVGDAMARLPGFAPLG